MIKKKTRILRLLCSILISVLLSGTIGFTAKAVIKNETITVPDEVYVGGFPFGVKLYCDGLIIIGFSDVDSQYGAKSPAKDAGMEINDIIIKVNNNKIESSADFTDKVENCNGKKLKISYIRDNKEHECEITPALSNNDGKYRMGLWLRDSTAGIGTVTFVLPANGVFAGLGHGICDNETGALVPLSKGIISDVKIEGIKKGVCGTPGELQGKFTGVPIGNLLYNTENGIYGTFDNSNCYSKDIIKLGDRNDIVDGDAYIVCTLDSGKSQKYSIKISEIHKESNSNKNFIITVTDKALIDKTGGIVQGMSGSPIIQNGKLVGAVTHVLVGDPTKGYGIFIDNMINIIK